MSSIEITENIINEFSELVKENPGPIPASVMFGDLSASKTALITAGIHGNEVGTLPAFLEFAKNINNISDGCLIMTLGNIEALKQNKRFIDEDMNRLFSELDRNTYERQRAGEIKQLIDLADYHLDLHQTIEPTLHPFYLLRPHVRAEAFAAQLDVTNMAIMTDTQKGVQDGYMTSGAYAYSKGLLSVTLEVSEKGYFKEATERTEKALYNFLSIYLNELKSDHYLESQNNKSLTKITMKSSEAYHSKKSYLLDGFKNLQFVNKGTHLGVHPDKPDSEQNFYAPEDGYLLFPKYPERNKSGECLTWPQLSSIYVLGQSSNY